MWKYLKKKHLFFLDGFDDPIYLHEPGTGNYAAVDKDGHFTGWDNNNEHDVEFMRDKTTSWYQDCQFRENTDK
jgi:hypothetical protein